MSAKAKHVDAGKKMLEWIATPAAETVYAGVDPSNIGASTQADTGKYNALQQKSAQLISSAKYVLSGGAAVGGCSGCSGSQKVGSLGHEGTLTFTGVQAAKAGSRTITVVYDDGDTNGRPLTYSANGGPQTTIQAPGTGGWNTVGTLTITVPLQAGANTITFTGPDSTTYSPDIDRIML
jgi:alpha-galactosidase